MVDTSLVNFFPDMVNYCEDLEGRESFKMS